MGSGIFLMHYIGMAALHASAHMEHSPPFVVVSWIIAVAASGLALWLATGQLRRPPLILSAVAFGIAVSGMHYTAMAGMTLFSSPIPSSGAPALSTDLLAIVVAVVAFCVSGLFLLVLMPDRSREKTPSVGGAPVHAEILQVAGVPAASAFVKNGDGNEAQFGRGTYAPLGGAGGPPPRIAHHLPVERDGATHFIAVEDVVAVHANAHYTYVFNGSLKLFCPLAIGEVESRLDKSRFIRVHRSHIINIERVIGHRRSGDSEVVEMAASDHYSVPVSRSRITRLKSRIAAKAG
jgi:hypothetical protein